MRTFHRITEIAVRLLIINTKSFYSLSLNEKENAINSHSI